MISNLIWWSAMALEAIVLLRGVKGRLIRSYPLFYGYICSVLTIEILRFGCYSFKSGFYPNFYWYSEFVVILASYVVILEIYRRSFKYHPGVARLAQRLLVFALVMTVVGVAANTWIGGFRSWAIAVGLLDCDLRYVEGALLAVVLFLLGIFHISLGRNLRGLIAGYGFLVGMNVMNLVLLSHPGNEFSFLLRRLLPVTYVITLLIWCVALWSPGPDPVPPAENEIERDHEVLAAKTRAILARVTNRLVRAMRT